MEKIVLFAPLVGSLLAGFGWRMIGEKAAQLLTTGILFLSCLLSWYLFLSFDGVTRHTPVLDWVVTGDFHSEWAIRIDRLTVIMLIVALSRFLAMPKYLNKLSLTSFGETTVSLLTQTSFGVMVVALLIGAGIILASMFKARRLENQA